MPHYNIPEMFVARAREAMKAFSNWWVIGMNGQIVAKNGSMDPLKHWVNVNVSVSAPPRQRSKPEYVPERKRRHMWRKDPL